MGKRLTTEEFIAKARAVHGDRYGYEKVAYVNTDTKVIITCPQHDDFEQTPHNHLNGHVCLACSGRKKLTAETFIKKAKAIHGDKYSYNNVAYIQNKAKVIITCPEHGDFEQTPNGHLMGQSCPTCGGTKKLTTETFIEKAKAIHGDKCSYDKVEYVNHATKVIITCPEHGDFEQTPNSHLDGKGCLACSGRKQLTTETFIEKAKAIHGDKYSYDKVEYEKIYDKVMLTCPEHGDFEQVAHDHLRRNGCGKCINKAEGKIAIHLNERFIMHRQHRVENKFFDFYLPKYNLLIERDGEQHYQIVGHWVTGEDEEYVENQQANDQHKTDLAKEHGYKIARIPYWLTDEEVELDNILKGQPTYPDVPDLEQVKTQPKPYNFGGSEV